MAFCRWANDCDIYCYQSDDKFITMVAEYRQKDNSVFIFDPACDNIKETYDKFMKKIDLQFAGEEFSDNTLQGMLNRVLRLREIGYLIPQEKIDNIQKTINKEDIFY